MPVPHSSVIHSTFHCFSTTVFSWNPTIYSGFQLKLKELLMSVVPAWVILTILIIIIIPFSPKTSNSSCKIEYTSILKRF